MRRLYSVAFWVALGLLPFAARAQGTPKIVVVGLSAAQVSELKAAARASFVSVLSPGEALQQIGNADLIATGRPMVGSKPRYTTPIAPRPNSSWIW